MTDPDTAADPPRGGADDPATGPELTEVSSPSTPADAAHEVRGARAGGADRPAGVGVDPIEPPDELIHTDTHAAAFFDLDNTVIQGASLFHLAKGLYRRDFFGARVIAKGLWLQAYFRLVGHENPEHIAEAQAASLSFITGRTVAEIQQAGEEIYEESIVERIWPGTRAIAQLHLDVGHQVWLVTAAPVEIAVIIAERLGLTGALGSTAESVDGVYTGRLTGPLLHGPAKAAAVQALAERHGFELTGCFAYSDSLQRPAAALPGRPPLRHQPGQAAAAARRGARLAAPRLPGPAVG